MGIVSQPENRRTVDVYAVPAQRKKLSITEADIIFYGDNALAGAKEFASLEVGQGFPTMTPGMSRAVTVLVRRGTWALYNQENYGGQMTLVSPGENDIVYGSFQEGIHSLKTSVCSYKRIR
jgi:Beta/Gamma crystallin